MVEWAEVAAGTRHTEAATKLYGLLEPLADQFPCISITTWMPTAHYLGLLAVALGKREAADAHFARALELEDGFETPLFAASTRLAWGQAQLESEGDGDPKRGRELLKEALAAGRELGIPRVEGRAESLLGSTAPSA